MNTMTTTTTISLAKLIPSPANARRTGIKLGIEALAASIQAHGLLQSLVVQPKLDDMGEASGRYEVVAGARRLAALKLLARQKHLAKSSAIPCRVLDGTAGSGFEASLAENVVRQDMHPADQFEAFAALHGGGMGQEDIVARFGVSVTVVRQRLRLAVVSPALIQAYRKETLTLDHLMAFAVTEDQAAQEAVFHQLQDWQRSPDTIRRLLTHALLSTTDRKVRFVGLEAYTAAGGTVQHDLFSEDRGGWIADPALLERLLAERLEQEAASIKAEGWRWIGIGAEVQAEAWRLRRVLPRQVGLSPEDEARRDEMARRYDELVEAHGNDADDLPEAVAAELSRLDVELVELSAKTEAYRPEEVAVAGAVITLTMDGSLRVDRGFVRVEDEAQPVTAEGGGEAGADGVVTTLRPIQAKSPTLSGALLAELAAHRTAGLQAALSRQPDLALRVMLHGLASDAFYRWSGTVAPFHALTPFPAGLPRHRGQPGPIRPAGGRGGMAQPPAGGSRQPLGMAGAARRGNAARPLGRLRGAGGKRGQRGLDDRSG